jgi:hypothetical protein
MALSLDVKIGGSLWSASVLSPLSRLLIWRPPDQDWASGVKAERAP